MEFTNRHAQNINSALRTELITLLINTARQKRSEAWLKNTANRERCCLPQMCIFWGPLRGTSEVPSTPLFSRESNHLYSWYLHNDPRPNNLWGNWPTAKRGNGKNIYPFSLGWTALSAVLSLHKRVKNIWTRILSEVATRRAPTGITTFNFFTFWCNNMTFVHVN